MLIDLVRISFQHRTLCCYSVLLVWIILLILGMYRYMPGKPEHNSRAIAPDDDANDADTYHRAHQQAADFASVTDAQHSRMLAECSQLDEIVVREDGGLLADWQMLGVLMLIRHGDRGPMVHVRGVNAINCGAQGVPAVERYRKFLANTTTAGTAGSAGSYGSGSGGSGRPTWTKTGPFHGNPLLPSFATSCLLGQLTYKGIAQLLHTGELLRHIYGAQLGLYRKPPHALNMVKSSNASSSSGINLLPSAAFADDGLIDVYSTRYRRTFQSAMAFMFGLLPTAERWLSLTVRESHSIAFCFDDCVCPLIGALQKSMVYATASASLAGGTLTTTTTTTTPMIVPGSLGSVGGPAGNVMQLIRNTLLENAVGHLHPMELRDAVLAVLCHGGRMPCRRPGDDDRMAGVVMADASSASRSAAAVTVTETTIQSDFINIDQDDEASRGGGGGGSSGNPAQSGRARNSINLQQLQFINHERQNLAFESNPNHHQRSPSQHLGGDDTVRTFAAAAERSADQHSDTTCIQPSHIAHLMAHTHRLRLAELRHADNRRRGLLRAYGLLRHIVANILRMVSGARTKFVLYAGHDRTLEYLLAALGVTGADSAADGAAAAEPDVTFIPYAARLAFEVYRSTTNGEHYFRVVYNGRDVTSLVLVCAGGRSLRMTRASRRGGKAALCPIENIVRFVHDDYFAPFNTTNFRDACQVVKVL